MTTKRAKRGGEQATRNAKNTADVRRKTLRRQAGEVKRIELQLKADNARDQYIADELNKLDYGTTSEFVRCAIEEKIARVVSARNEQVAANNALDDFRAQVRELQQQNARLHEDNVELRLNGNVPFEAKATTAIEDREKALSGKLKGLSFAGL